MPVSPAPSCLLIGPFPEWDEVERLLIARGWAVGRVESGAEAFRRLSSDRDLFAVVLPREMRDGRAENLLVRARGLATRADFVVLGPPGRPEDRASLLADGADEVLELPIAPEQLVSKLTLLRDRRRLIDDLELVVRDPRMLELLERILRVGPLKVTVLITGESGTGKEMLAQAIHRVSPRRDGPFIPVNVGALPETLLESELFGHERGAFTGADARRLGRFEMANGGTLFLDEIGEMSMTSQVNLLRVLEEEKFLRVGGSQSIEVDVRVVAATNRDLEEMVRAGRFRRDLYYRLNVVHLRVPPLRERTSEIPLLARELARRAATRHGLRFPGFGKAALDALARYEWPGNVRELRNLVDGLVALRPETPIEIADLPTHVLHGHAPGGTRPLPALPPDRTEAEREFVIQSLLALRAEVAAIREMLRNAMPHGLSHNESLDYMPRRAASPVYPTTPVRVEDADPAASLKDLERGAIEKALRDSNGNRRLAAETLGISERTLYRRIRQFGLADEVF
ncbi:MAG: sigma-54-dependent Fis family transcriptional regulator [Gemmatimonadetes bacterium]|nr:sigma-54-dependent Fis family transcriptional regulator [Gemmatimonadota bacterium]